MKKEIQDLESAVLKECIAGDYKACNRLYNYYSPKMRDICRRYARTTFEAEDILQDAFIKIFINLPYYKPTGSLFRWMRKIVKHTAINHIKKERISENLIFLEISEQTSIETENVINVISTEELLDIVKAIPKGYNTVFNMHEIQGYSHPEIAEKLNISESSSRSQLCKARNYLKNVLDKHKVNAYEENT